MSHPTWTVAVHWNVGGPAERRMPAEYFANLEDIGNGNE
jgi:hypothetical protein